MSYKDKSFEIDDNQIKFKNNIYIVYMGLYIGVIGSRTIFDFFSNSISMLGITLNILWTTLCTLLTFRVFILLYWKNTINISEISQVKIITWDSSIDKDKNFWGMGRYKYHFPLGLNKKTNPKVIFVERKNKKLASRLCS